jgi:nucleoside 2-deoxyribosyltransferase
MGMPKIYLAVPYSQDKERGLRAACKGAARLMTEGNIVFSPISHSHGIDAFLGGAPWEMWRKTDLFLLEACDQVTVIMLPGWEKSTGVTAEIMHAREKGIPVHFLPPEYVD